MAASSAAAHTLRLLKTEAFGGARYDSHTRFCLSIEMTGIARLEKWHHPNLFASYNYLNSAPLVVPSYAYNKAPQEDLGIPGMSQKTQG